ncbi:MAG: RpiB/LacA/LacB family sugar-phosphate isomerase [Chloroflexota bacterium]
MSDDAEGFVIAVGADSLGRGLLDVLLADLRADPRVRRIIDLGVPATDDTTAYPHVGIAVAEAVARGEAHRALLVCGTGIGMSISANKVRGVRAAVAHDPYSLERSVKSNDCQVLCMGANVVAPMLARSLLSAWLGHRFDPASPSEAKVAIIRAFEAGTPSEDPPAG